MDCLPRHTGTPCSSSCFAMEPHSAPPELAAGIYDRACEQAFPAGSGSDKTDLGLGMSQPGLDYGVLSSDALSRVYPIRSVIEIDHSISSSSNDQQTSRERGGIAGGGSTSISGQLGYRWGDSGWTTKIQQADDNIEAPYITTRFTHRITQDGYMVMTGVAGAENLQRCEVSSTSFRLRGQKADGHFHGF